MPTVCAGRHDPAPRGKQCPLGFLCASRLCDDRYLLPSFIDVGYGEMISTDLAPRQRVFVIRSGLFVSTAYANEGKEIPFGVFGKGFMTGTVEIFGPYTASNFNYLSGTRSRKTLQLRFRFRGRGHRRPARTSWSGVDGAGAPRSDHIHIWAVAHVIPHEGSRQGRLGALAAGYDA